MVDMLCDDQTSHSWGNSNSLKATAAAPAGVLVLMNCQGSAELVFGQFATWGQAREQAAGDPHRFDLRTYGIGAQILRDLDVGVTRLLALPRKMPSMTGFSLDRKSTRLTSSP